MKKTNIIYWIATILVVMLFGFGGVMNALSSKDSITLIVGHLGYPGYIVSFLGVAKVLGVIAILVPGFPRLKEWAYAGLCFDLAGAMYSSIAVGDPLKSWIFFPVFFVLIGVSYCYHHKRLKAKLA